MHGIIYSLHDPMTHELRYIGQTIKTPQARLAVHLSPSSLKRHSYLARWLKSLVWRGHRPSIVVLATAETQAELDALEVQHIAAERAKGTRLVNLSDGGGGRAGYVPTAAEREKISAAQVGVPRAKWTEERKQAMSALFTGRPSPNTEEHHRRLAEAKRGVPRSAEERAKMSAAMKGRKASAETRAKMSAARIGKTHAGLPGEAHPMFRHDISTADLVARLSAPGMTVAQLARDMGLSRTFIHRRLKARTQ